MMKTVSASLALSMLCSMLLLLSACGPKRPVFYPNAYFTAVGEQQAQADIDLCMAQAEAHGAQNEPGKKIAGDAAKGAAIGAATSAVVAAVLTRDVGRALGAGAAGGATAGAVSGAIDANDPDQIYRNFVERCLREKGYEVIGWK